MLNGTLKDLILLDRNSKSNIYLNDTRKLFLIDLLECWNLNATRVFSTFYWFFVSFISFTSVLLLVPVSPHVHPLTLSPVKGKLLVLWRLSCVMWFFFSGNCLMRECLLLNQTCGKTFYWEQTGGVFLEAAWKKGMGYFAEADAWEDMSCFERV